MDMLTFLKTMLFLLNSKLTALRLGDFAGVAHLSLGTIGPHPKIMEKCTLLISYGLPITERS